MLSKSTKGLFFFSSPPLRCQWGNTEKKAKAGKKSLKKNENLLGQMARRSQLHSSGL